MGKIVLFCFIVFFVIVFPFFVKVSNSIVETKKIIPLEIEKGTIYDYNYSLKEVIKFQNLQDYKKKMYFKKIDYSNRENNYRMLANEATYDKRTKILEGSYYHFFTDNMSGSGFKFKKIFFPFPPTAVWEESVFRYIGRSF